MKKKAFIGIVLAAFLICGCAKAPASHYKRSVREVFADGIEFSAAVRGGNEDAALAEMSKLMDDLNSDMSITLSSSALARFNASTDADATFEVTAETHAVLLRALDFYEKTGGVFNIAVPSLSALWHVDTEGLSQYSAFGGELAPPPPSYEEVVARVEHCDLHCLRLTESDGKYTISKTDPLLKIDLGAIAKGYAADRCAEIVKKHNVESALINVGNNIYVVGEWFHPKQEIYVRWEIGVTAPRPRGGFAGEVCALSVPSDYTVVTSGDYRRYVLMPQDDTVLYVSHIVNGKTGLPQGIAYDGVHYVQKTDFVVSAVLLGSDSTKADAFATAACLMDYDEAVAFLRAQHCRGILFTEDKKMALVGVSESGDEEVFFTQKDVYNAYCDYTIEEYSLD